MTSSSPQDESDYTLPQQVANTLVPAFSGTLSILGSTCIIWMLLGQNLKKLKSVKYRFLFALCWCDIIYSLVFVFWSLPIPKGTPGVWGAIGNYTSCNVQGFLLQFGNIGSFYNTALSLYFYKSLCHSMNDEQIAKRYEKWIHLGSFVWPLGTAIAAWQQDLYSFSGIGCWMAPEPLRCHRREDVECIRGEDAYIYAWVYTGVPLLVLCGYITYSMGMIYLKVREVSRLAEKWSLEMVGASFVSGSSGMQSSERNINDESLSTPSQTVEASSRRVSISGNDNQARSRYAVRTKEAAWQAFLYVFAYCITHMWSFVVVLIEQCGGTAPFYVILIENFFWPLQGFANVFIFLRPRINSIQKGSPEMYYFTAAYHSVFHYDDVRHRLTESANPPAALDEGSEQISGTTNTSDLVDLANESRNRKDQHSQPAIQEETSSHHDIDEGPTLAEDALVA
jgi:hypothetical protein